MVTFHYEETIPILQELADIISQKIILSTIDAPKSAQQIAAENHLPQSSTYKKIRKLCTMKLLCVDKIQLNGSGKKVFYYKSKVRSCQFNLGRGESVLQFEKNEGVCVIEGIRISR